MLTYSLNPTTPEAEKGKWEGEEEMSLLQNPGRTERQSGPGPPGPIFYKGGRVV